MGDILTESLLNAQRLGREAGGLRVKMPDGFTARIEGRDIVIAPVEPVKPGWWRPADHWPYYHVLDDGLVRESTWGGRVPDFAWHQFGNVFPTRKAAERDARYTRARRRLQQFADHLNPEGWEPEWSYTIHWSLVLHARGAGVAGMYGGYGVPVFHSQEAAEQALQWMQEEGLIEDYFGITEETP